MRFLHVTPTYLPAVRYGGPIFAVHGLCRALVQRGHEVHVFTTNVDGTTRLDVDTDAAVGVDGVSVRYFPSRYDRLYWSPAMAAAMKTHGPFDVIHSHALYLWPGIAAVRTARASHTPIVISPRGMLVRDLVSGKNRFVKTLWLELVERRNFARASAIHFTSDLELREARRFSLPIPNPVVVPNGVELRPRPAVERHPAMLLFLGRLSWKKRVEKIIEALPAVPAATLTVAGNDDEGLTPRLRRLARDLGVHDRVTFTGPVHGTLKDELMARAALFVLPSASENFANTVLEAMAMSTPVVVSPGVGLAETVERAGAGVVAEDLGRALPPLLEDAAKRAVMGENGRRLVEQEFSWPIVAARMEEAYRCLIESLRSS